MTDIVKAVTRRTKECHPSRKRRVIVTLGPGDTVGLRLERGQRTHYKDVHELFSQLEMRDAAISTGANVAPCKNPMKARNV